MYTTICGAVLMIIATMIGLSMNPESGVTGFASFRHDSHNNIVLDKYSPDSYRVGRSIVR